MRIKRIANGEKIIVPGDGRDEAEVRIMDDESEGVSSWVKGLHEAFREYEKEHRKFGRTRRSSGPESSRR